MKRTTRTRTTEMRMYARDIARGLFGEGVEMMAIAVICALAYEAWVAAFLLASMAVGKWRRAREFRRVTDGYVDLSPGIQVVTQARPDRSRDPPRHHQN